MRSKAIPAVRPPFERLGPLLFRNELRYYGPDESTCVNHSPYATELFRRLCHEIGAHKKKPHPPSETSVCFSSSTLLEAYQQKPTPQRQARFHLRPLDNTINQRSAIPLPFRPFTAEPQACSQRTGTAFLPRGPRITPGDLGARGRKSGTHLNNRFDYKPFE